MIEVVRTTEGWTWVMICAVGRVLAYPSEHWPTDGEAAEAARRYRAAFWAVADLIDHRQARAI